MTYDPNAEPTHSIPEELEVALIEAKRWYDSRQEQVAAGIPDSKAWTDSDLEGNHLLAEIVGVIGATWGWGPKAGQS